MKKPSPHFLFFFFLFFFVTIRPSSSESLISSTCKALARTNRNIEYGFCTTSLQAAPASQCASTRGLGIIGIRGARYNVTDTRCFIKQLLKNRKWEDPYAKQCLGDCLDLYSDAIDTVKQAMKYYSAKRFEDANIYISSVMDASTTCEDCFHDGGAASPLTKRNDDVSKIGSVVLALMAIMKNQTGSLA